MKEVVIVDCIRTPMGRSKEGIFRNVRAENLSGVMLNKPKSKALILREMPLYWRAFLNQWAQ